MVTGRSTHLTNFRWYICALLFFATTINYVDRQVIGILKPTLQADLGWSERDYAAVIFWFQAAYAIGLLGAGRLLDLVGVRRGYLAAVAFWSVAAIAHGFAGSAASFAMARFALGLGEAGNFPAAVKAVSDWFPDKERGLAIGIFNAGSNVGALLTPLLIPPIVLAFGWRTAFVAAGSLGFIWLVFWVLLYRRPEESPRVSPAELTLITAGRPVISPTARWTEMLMLRSTWAFAVGKFLTDPVWWFFLFWLPGFFSERHGLDLQSFGPPLIAIYILADLGSIGGGWLSSWLIGRGMPPTRARQAAMLLCAVCVLPVGFAHRIGDLVAATMLIGVAAAAHQGWSANLFALAGDTSPPRTLASVVGLGGMLGAVGGMLMARQVGAILDSTGSYAGIFSVISLMYLLAWVAILLLTKRHKEVQRAS